MEVKVFVHYDTRPEVSRWTAPGRRFHSPQPPRIVSTPFTLKPTAAAATLDIVSLPPSNRPDYSIRNKTKLLQLADRIQETNKKGSQTGNTPIRNADIVLTSPTPHLSQSKRLFEDSIGLTLDSSAPLLHKVGNSFRRSKLYASFSPRKRSLQKLVKTDPAKTNIEHLVNHRSPSYLPSQGQKDDDPGRDPVSLSRVIKTPQAFVVPNGCFHDSLKLSAAFSGGNNPIPQHKPNTKQSLLQQGDADGSELELPRQRHHRKVLESPHVDANLGHAQLGPIEPSRIPAPSPKNLAQKTATQGTCKGEDEEGSCLCEVDANVIPIRKCNDPPHLVRINQEPRKHKALTASVSHNSYFSQGDEDQRLIKITSAVEIRKRSRSLPRSSVQSISKGVFRNVMILPQHQPIGFWNEVGFEKLKGIEERRTTATCAVPETPAVSTSFPPKMRLEKREGRPMSLDYGQRKAWLRAIGDMEVAAASRDSLSPPPLPGKRWSKPTSKGPLSITHLHLTESEAEGREESPETSSVGSSKSSTPSLFQRFSKTFSLRFGSSSPKEGKPPKACRLPSRSSPDISLPQPDESPRKMKTKVDPSSGKIRRRPVNAHRGDKCQSGDSGIQLGEEEQNSSPASRKSSPDFLNTRRQGSEPGSPASMKKLSLVEIPRPNWDLEGGEEKKEEDAGFVSANEEDGDARPIQNGSSPPTSNFHSLPLKYSRQRKAELLQEKKANVRGNVVKELLTTEANYVKSLNDIVHGFLVPCRARSDLFNEKTVCNIFSNVEDILRLHARMLERLQSAVAEEDENLSEARIGHIFVDWAEEFELYSEYCYQNPMSMATVRQLSLNREYAEFFEACRRLQLMDKLPLHGFLLRPIQRICQYHLQLNELLKYTPVSHEDYEDVNVALSTMKDVAMKVNDTQRKFDSLQEIVRIQAAMLDWEGPDLVPGSTAVLFKGDVIKTTLGHKPKEAHLILLNNELLICRRDYYKKGTLSLSCRLPLCSWGWMDLNGEYVDEYFGAVQNSWRVFNPSETKWILLTAPSPHEKEKWMAAFEKSQNPYPVDPKMSEMAKFTALKLMLTESQSQQAAGSGLIFPTTSTLPRLRKNRKNSSLTKSDSDAMLIEVGKLRKSSHFPPSQAQHYGSGGDKVRPNSKFYV